MVRSSICGLEAVVVAETLFTILKVAVILVVSGAIVMILGFLASMVVAGYESYKHRVPKVPSGGPA